MLSSLKKLKLREDKNMDLRNKNMDFNSSIGCTVSECRFHARGQSYCTLNKINVVKHEPADSFECTDCGSFETGYKYNLPTR